MQVLAFPIAPRAVGVADRAERAPCRSRSAARHPVAALIVGTAWWAYPTDGYLVVGYVASVPAPVLVRGRGRRPPDRPRRAGGPVRPVGRRRSCATTSRSASGSAASSRSARPVAVGRFVRRERERTHQTAVSEERARIARELHDVVAHGVSVIAVQADAAEAALEHDPARAATPLRSIRGSAQDALAEMRRMVGVLGETHERGPAARARAAARADRRSPARRWRSPASRSRCRPSLDLAAYRIVQEALTNVRKHAGSAPTTVRLSWREDVLELDVARPRPRAERPRRGPRARRDARARADPRRPPAHRPGRRRRLRGQRGAPAVIERRARRRPGAGPQRLPPDPRARRASRFVGEAGDGRAAVRARACDAARRRADGHPHAGDGRDRGDAPDRPGRPPQPRPRADHVRPRRVRLRGAARRRQRLPAQGRRARAARRRRQDRRGRRGAVRADRAAAARRPLRAPAADRASRGSTARSPTSQSARPRCCGWSAAGSPTPRSPTSS